jgi:hypothetical protein
MRPTCTWEGKGYGYLEKGVWTTGHGGTLWKVLAERGRLLPAWARSSRPYQPALPGSRWSLHAQNFFVFLPKNAQNLCGHSCMQTVAKALLLRTLDPPLFFRKFCGIILNKETMHFGNNTCLFLHLSFKKIIIFWNLVIWAEVSMFPFVLLFGFFYSSSHNKLTVKIYTYYVPLITNLTQPLESAEQPLSSKSRLIKWKSYGVFALCNVS